MKAKHFSIFVLALFATFTLGCAAGSNGGIGPQNQSTISVSGTGTVSAQPDMIQMSINLSKVAQTTKMAQEEVNKMVRQALKVLKEANVEDKNINTASLRFSSEYDYSKHPRILIGQKAEQGITFSIEGINNDSGKASGIIDQLIQINGIELNQINFSVKNPTEYFVKSRELAYKKAVEKANQYAELSKLKIVKVLSVSENGFQPISPIQNRLYNQRAAFAVVEQAAADATVLPVGELEITTNISVVFLLE
ncbi:MAG: SIMPL domain-containing protein [Fibromonadaceae bacterium]|jgi:uncharacterized protein YggE|nr:SIMPL domain-containing protein [Fibromonadaceae bacterium]